MSVLRALRRSHRRSRGQALVEFALVLPILVILLVGIIDLARIYTTMLNVESAAREAADYGAFGSYQWKVDVRANTVAEMERRACVATQNLPDYSGSDSECTNPEFLLADVPEGCDSESNEPPCNVSVTLRYTFRPLVPLNFDVFGLRVGVPSAITFERTSTFAMSDLNVTPP